MAGKLLGRRSLDEGRLARNDGAVRRNREVYMYCNYYVVAAHRHMIWLIVAHLKSHDNVAFHRTMDGASDVLEFFVTPAYEEQLVRWFALYLEEGFIFSYKKEPNRLMQELESTTNK